MGAFLRALRKQDAVVGDDSYWVTPDTGEAADQGWAVQALEFVEFASIHEARDKFSHVIRRATVGRNDGVQFLRRIARRDGPAQFNRRPLHRVQTRDDAASGAERVSIVLSVVIGDARGAAVHIGAAEVFGADHLAGRRLDERRTGKKD